LVSSTSVRGNEIRISVYCVFPPDIAIQSNLYQCTIFMIQRLRKRLRNVFCNAAAEKETACKKTIMIKLSKSANIFTEELSLQQWRVQEAARLSLWLVPSNSACSITIGYNYYNQMHGGEIPAPTCSIYHRFSVTSLWTLWTPLATFYSSVAWRHRERVCCGRYIATAMRQVSWQLLCCCVRALPSNGWQLESHLLATGLYATISKREPNLGYGSRGDLKPRIKFNQPTDRPGLLWEDNIKKDFRGWWVNWLRIKHCDRLRYENIS
jgi:hypothetical protein